MKTVVIDQKFLETCATGTLMAAALEGHGLPKELTLAFPQTTLGWRVQHGGPDQLIMNEYVPACLIHDILMMVNRGVTITVFVTNDPLR